MVKVGEFEKRIEHYDACEDCRRDGLWRFVPASKFTLCKHHKLMNDLGVKIPMNISQELVDYAKKRGYDYDPRPGDWGWSFVTESGTPKLRHHWREFEEGMKEEC